MVAQGGYIGARESLLVVGNAGLGKTHIAIGLGLAACRLRVKVRFYNAAGLFGELLQAQDEHRLPKFFASALKQELIILDELGFIPFAAFGSQLIFQFCSLLYECVAMIFTTNLASQTGPRFSEMNASPRRCSTGLRTVSSRVKCSNRMVRSGCAASARSTVPGL